MTTTSSLTIGLVAVSVPFVLMVASMVLRRAWRQHHDARMAQRMKRIRPLAMEIATEGRLEEKLQKSLGRGDEKALVELLWQMVSKVRGSSRDDIVAWLEAEGALKRERKRLLSLRAVPRAKGAHRLGSVGDPEDAAHILPLLASRDRELRAVAVRALGRIGAPGTVGPVLHASAGRRRVSYGLVLIALLHMGPEVIDELQKELDHYEPSVRRIAAQVLGMHGAVVAIPKLIELSEGDSDWSVRIMSAVALGRIGMPNCLPPLVRIARVGPSSRERARATEAIGMVGSKEAVDVLLQLVGDPDELVSRVAVHALGRQGEPGKRVLVTIAMSNHARSAAARECLDQQHIVELKRQLFQERVTKAKSEKRLV